MVDQEFLTHTFPKEQIKRRPDGFDYIEWTSILERLLAAFDGRFDWVVHSAILTPESISERKGKDGKPYQKRIPAYWTVMGTLTLPDLGSRSGIGTAVVETQEAPKSAESDALKRAAVKFGIALHLYDKHPLQQARPAQRPTPPARPQPKNENPGSQNGRRYTREEISQDDTPHEDTHWPLRVDGARPEAVPAVSHRSVQGEADAPQTNPRNKCFALFTEIGAPQDDTANRAWLSKLLGFPVESRTQLSADHWSDIARILGLFQWARTKSECPYPIQEIFNRVAGRPVEVWTRKLEAWERCANWLRHEYQPDPYAADAEEALQGEVVEEAVNA